jgi:hypothetical protein
MFWLIGCSMFQQRVPSVINSISDMEPIWTPSHWLGNTSAISVLVVRKGFKGIIPILLSLKWTQEIFSTINAILANKRKSRDNLESTAKREKNWLPVLFVTQNGPNEPQSLEPHDWERRRLLLSFMPPPTRQRRNPGYLKLYVWIGKLQRKKNDARMLVSTVLSVTVWVVVSPAYTSNVLILIWR